MVVNVEHVGADWSKLWVHSHWTTHGPYFPGLSKFELIEINKYTDFFYARQQGDCMEHFINIVESKRKMEISFVQRKLQVKNSNSYLGVVGSGVFPWILTLRFQ